MMDEKEFIESVRVKIDPKYAMRIGTESYERRRLLEIIDRQAQEIEWLRQLSGPAKGEA